MSRLLLASLLFVGCAPEVATLPPALSSRYDAQFVAAGQKYDVPPELLAALSFSLTRFEMVEGGDEFEQPTFGLMALPASRMEDGRARTDAALNIDAAAKWLSTRATELRLDRRDLSAWRGVLAEYAMIDVPEASDAFLDEELYPLLGLRPAIARKQQALSPDYDLGIWRPSPHFNSRGGRTPQVVVIHTCEGAYSGCWGWQLNPSSQVSAHYTVSTTGEVTQSVRESDRAWHVAAQYQCSNNQGVRCDLNGISTNTIGVGIEHAGYASQTSFPGDQTDASARLVCSITRRWNIPRNRQHILSHGQLQPYNRTDPGANWPWAAFIERVRDHCGDNAPPPCDRTAGPFTFSCDGAHAGQTCVKLEEPGDPHTWGDNFLCTAADYGFRWSYTGPIEGMDCVGVHESAEPNAAAWADNFFCAPKQSPWKVSYSSAGPIAGRTCVHLNETADLANSWHDNFLCFEPRTQFTEGPFTFSMTGAVEGQACVNLDAPGDPDTWADNFFCSTEALGLRWSTGGPIDGLVCTQVTEPADRHAAAWSNTWLCHQPTAGYRFQWSSAGPREGQRCVRWFEHAETSPTWLDNWMCFAPIATAQPSWPVNTAQPIQALTEAPAGGHTDPAQRPVAEPGPVVGGCSSTGAAVQLGLFALAAWLRRSRKQTTSLT